MANRSYYHRSFIILKAENRGYGLKSGKEPAGYCKFEIRRGIGKAYIFVQDMKPSSTLDGVYEVYLISADSTIRPCKLASLHVDQQGRGEHIASFDANDIMGTGYSLENFHALTIAFRSESEGRGMKISYPLIGYSSRNVNIDIHEITESLKLIHGENIEVESEPIDQSLPDTEPEVELMDEEKVDGLTDTQPEVELMDEEEVDGLTDIQQEDESMVEEEVEGSTTTDTQPEDEVEIETQVDLESDISAQPEPESIPEMKFEPLTDFTEQDTQPIYDHGNVDQQGYTQGQGDLDSYEEELRRAYEDSYQEYLQDMNYQDDMYSYPAATYWDNVKDYFTGLFSAYQRVYPFDNQLGEAEWIKVPQAVPSHGGYYDASIYRYPYYGSSYPDHYILGLIKENQQTKYVVYGIPSMYSMIPPVSITGFSRWVPVKDGYGMGYWLLYIDAISGRVVYTYDMRE